MGVYTNLGLRLATAVIALPAIYWFIWHAPRLAFELLIGVIALLSALEFALMMFASTLFRGFCVLVTLGLFAAHVWLPAHTPALAADVQSILVIFSALLFGLARPEEILNKPRVYAWLGLGPLFLYFSARAIVDLHALKFGPGWIMLSLTLAWFSDSMAFFAGKRLGQHKLAPAVSPSKTVEGSLAGLLGSLLAACVAKLWYLSDLSWPEVFIIGIGVGILGQLGDLAESLIKRVSGQKDSGNLLPGHGGMFDRVDSFFFCSVALWLYAANIR